MKKTTIASCLTMILLASGCSSFDKMGHKENELTLEEERNSLSQGAALGAAVGLGVASVATTAGAPILAASLIGTGYFSFVGLQNDMDDEDVKAYLISEGISVKDHFDKVVLSFDEDVTFDLQKTELKDEFKPKLDGVAIVLNKLEGKAKFKIVGHADYTGPDGLNDYLSTERATVVTEYLLSKQVNPENFIDFYGVSSSEPKDYCLDLSCLRRIELIIYKDSLLTEIN